MMLIPTIKIMTLRNDEQQGSALGDAGNLENMTCEGCHFSVQSEAGKNYFKKYFFDDKSDSASLLCPFCQAVFLEETVREKFEIIFYPWLNQSEINLMANLLISTQVKPSSEYQETCRVFYDHLSCFGGSYLFDQLLHSGLTFVPDLSSAMATLHRKHAAIYTRRGELLAGVRLLPIPHAFEEEVGVWLNEWPKEFKWQGLAETWEQQAK